MTSTPAERIEVGGLAMVFEIEQADGEIAGLLSRQQAGAVRDALRWLAAHPATDVSTTEGTENG
jgi:hypothetical protein